LQIANCKLADGCKLQFAAAGWSKFNLHCSFFGEWAFFWRNCGDPSRWVKQQDWEGQSYIRYWLAHGDAEKPVGNEGEIWKRCRPAGIDRMRPPFCTLPFGMIFANDPAED